jgi:hypothetical protein
MIRQRPRFGGQRHPVRSCGKALGISVKMKRLAHALLLSFLLIPGAARAADSTPVIDLKLITTFPGQPIGIANAGDGSGRLFIIIQRGVIRIYPEQPQPFLDIRDRVVSGGERGLLGLAFHPDYAENGYFYVVYVDVNNNAVLSRFSVSGSDPNVADPNSETMLLQTQNIGMEHYAGQLQFGSDGYLYVGRGDGNLAGDPGSHAQNLGELLGKILRLDVDSAEPYAIPPTNPLVGVPGAREEIWAYGLRNPWRFSFDRATSDLYIADVGQFNWEEVNLQPAASPGGENYGWRRMEGSHCFEPSEDCNDGSLTLPILEYPHVDDNGFFGCAVIGGYSYRGPSFPLLDGVYFYGDFCVGKVWGTYRDAEGNLLNPLLLDTALGISSFGEDESGDVYVVDTKSRGLYRIRDLRPFCDVDVSKDVYVEGDVVTATKLRRVNLGDVAVPVWLRARLVPPSGPPVRLANRGADGSFQLPPGTDKNLGPRDLLTVGTETPRGTYSLECELSDPVTKTQLALDTRTFTVQ